MLDTGLTVRCMTELPRCYDVTITVDRDGGHPPNPADFAVAAAPEMPTEVPPRRWRSIEIIHALVSVIEPLVHGTDRLCSWPPEEV